MSSEVNMSNQTKHKRHKYTIEFVTIQRVSTADDFYKINSGNLPSKSEFKASLAEILFFRQVDK